MPNPKVSVLTKKETASAARKIVRRESDDQVLPPVTSDFIRNLRGCLKGEDSLVEAWEREHRIEKDRTAR